MSAQWSLPGYTVEQLVGFGGSGEVWRGRDANGRAVALKRLHGCDDFARQRLHREAALLTSFAGEHVVRLRDVVLTDTESVLVMDYADGGNLATVLGVRGRLAPPEVVTLVGPLAGALADAHDRGLVHGDVTPANIVFTADGRPLLADFGVARVIGEMRPTVEGTPDYLAPEVLRGAEPTPAADVYALCRIAHDALDQAMAPPALVTAIDAGLADDPHDRPPARQLARAVLRSCAAAPVGLVRAGAPVTAPPTVTVSESVPRHDPEPAAAAPSPPRHRRRVDLATRVLPRRLVVAGVALAVLVLAVAGGVVWGHRTQSSAAALPPPATPAPATAPVADRWLDVVQALAARRAAAFAAADEHELRDLYVAGSAALATDVTTLRMLRREGLRPRDFVITTTAVRQAAGSASSVVLRVTDAISAYELVDSRGRVLRRVAARPPQDWTLSLRRIAGQWRIATVSR